MVGTRKLVRQRTQRQLAPPQVALHAGCDLLLLVVVSAMISIKPHISEIYEGDIA